MEIQVTSYTVEASMMIDGLKVVVVFTHGDRKGRDSLSYMLSEGSGGGMGLLSGESLVDFATHLRDEVARKIGMQEADKHFNDFITLIEKLSDTKQEITPDFLDPRDPSTPSH